MELTIRELKINDKSLHPELVFISILKINKFKTLPIDISGELSFNNLKLCDLNVKLDDSYKPEFIGNSLGNFDLHLNLIDDQSYDNIGDKRKDYQKEYRIHLITKIDRIVLDAIERLRKGTNVNFEVRLDVKYLYSELDKKRTSYTNSEQYNVNLLKLRRRKVREILNIKRDKWINFYAPKLGIGEFILLEMKPINSAFIQEKLNKPELADVKNTLEPIFDKLSEILSKMQQYLLKGEWDLVMRYSREFFELLKFRRGSQIKNALKVLFEQRNGSTTGFNEFYEGLIGFFNYISKFIHEKDPQGNLQVKPIPHSEDAYMTYSFCLNIMNIIVNKL